MEPIVLTPDQMLHLSRANQNLLDALSGKGDIDRAAITLISMINVLVLPSHMSAS